MELDGRVLYRRIWAEHRPAPHNLEVEQTVPGRARAMWFSRLTKRWEFDPVTIGRVIADDVDQGSGAVVFVDRAAAEQTARAMGLELPTETELAAFLEWAGRQMEHSGDWDDPIPMERRDPPPA